MFTHIQADIIYEHLLCFPCAVATLWEDNLATTETYNTASK